ECEGARLLRLPYGARHHRLVRRPPPRDPPPVGARPRDFASDLSGYLSRPGERDGLLPHRDLRRLPHRAPDPPGRRPASLGRARESPEDVPEMSCRGDSELLPLRPAREHARQGAEPSAVVDGPVHEDPPRRGFRVFRDPHGPLVPPVGQGARRREPEGTWRGRRTRIPMMTEKAPAADGTIWVRRFDRFDRSLHILLMASFLGLSLTGVPLLFSDRPWAASLSRLFGGFRSAATLHRVFATGMLVCFGSHLARLAKRLFGDKEYGILWGPSSLVPQPRDLP